LVVAGKLHFRQHSRLTVWQKKGPQAYVTYHNAIYATGHNEGKLTAEDIHGAASKAGLTTPALATIPHPWRKTVTWLRRWDSPNAGDHRHAR
jgi:hypothetical protein